MPRQNKPWYWKARGKWCFKINGVRHRLGPDEDKAIRKFQELMAQAPETITPGTVAEVIEAFMGLGGGQRPEKLRVVFPLVRTRGFGCGLCQHLGGAGDRLPCG